MFDVSLLLPVCLKMCGSRIVQRETGRERERERERETERQRQRDRKTETDIDRDRERQRQNVRHVSGLSETYDSVKSGLAVSRTDLMLLFSVRSSRLFHRGHPYNGVSQETIAARTGAKTVRPR